MTAGLKPLPPLDEASRRIALRRMQRVATGLLVLAAVTFLIAHHYEPFYPWLGYVRATAEASVVGAIADWFAVTALFRHPLGIPIPHTAIMQTQKDRVGRILGNFVQNHFLERSVLENRLASLRPGERAAGWMQVEENRRKLARQMAGGLSRAVEALPDAEVRGYIQKSAVARLENVRLAPLVSEVIATAAAGNRPQELLDEVIRVIGSAIRDGRDRIREKVREESPKWVPLGLRDAVADRMINAVEKVISEMATDPSHPLRHRFDGVVADFITRLRTSPDTIARVEAFKRDLLDHPMMEELVASIWDRVRDSAVNYRQAPESVSLIPLEEGLAGLADSLATNDELRGEIDRFVIGAGIDLLERHRQDVADLIAQTVAEWDPEVAAGRIELAVGRDLQFVRINGTIVGGLVGLILYTLTRLF